MLEYVPSYLKVVRHLRPKLSCRACGTIVRMPMPSLPIERGRPGPGLFAHVLVSKYRDHQPLHRQGVIYALPASISIAPPWPIGWDARSSCWWWPWPRQSAGRPA